LEGKGKFSDEIILKAASNVKEGFPKIANSHMNVLSKAASNSNKTNSQTIVFVYLSGFRETVHFTTSIIKKTFHDCTDGFRKNPKI
jgi:hypothetical protein